MIDLKDFTAYGVLHFRDNSNEGIGFTVYYNFSEENMENYHTPLLLGIARCHESTYNKKVGRELARSRVLPHHIPIGMHRQIRTKKALLSYIKDYMMGFIIPRYEYCGHHPEYPVTDMDVRFVETAGANSGVWYTPIELDMDKEDTCNCSTCGSSGWKNW